MKIKQEKIKKFISDILVGLKTKKIDANLISSHLVKSDMCGHYSHGIRRIVQYIDSVKAGNIKINNKPTIVKKDNNFIKINANFVFGQVAMDYCCKKIIKTKKDLCVLSIINAAHVGRLSEYAKKLSNSGYINIIFCSGGGPNVSLYPVNKRLIGTNPISISMPINKKKNIVLDFSTSMLAEGKVNLARETKKNLNMKAIINKKGNYSKVPSDFYNGGSLRAFGDFKGSGLAFMLELLSGMLISNNLSFKKNYKDANNCLIICFKKNKLTHPAFLKNLSEFKTILKASKKINKNNNQKIFLPGEIEDINYKIAKKKGIIYKDSIIKIIKKRIQKDPALKKITL